METNDNYKEHNIHETYDEHCSTCYSKNKTMKGLEGDFSFENVIKMVGNVNRAIYGKNPYEKRNI